MKQKAESRQEEVKRRKVKDGCDDVDDGCYHGDCLKQARRWQQQRRSPRRRRGRDGDCSIWSAGYSVAMTGLGRGAARDAA